MIASGELNGCARQAPDAAGCVAWTLEKQPPNGSAMTRRVCLMTEKMLTAVLLKEQNRKQDAS